MIVLLIQPLQSHTHDNENFTVWEKYLELLGDPAHWLFEITVTIIVDVILLTLVWGVVIKKIIIPKIRNDVKKQLKKDTHLNSECDPSTSLVDSK